MKSEGDNERVQQRHVTTELMSAYLDTRVSEEERRHVENHLAACETCSAALDSLRRTVAVLRAVPSPPLPRAFVIGPHAVQPRVIPLWRQPHVLQAFSGLAAAAMVVLLVGDALGLGAIPMSQQAAAPLAKVEAPLRGLRQEPAAPASRSDDALGTLSQDRSVPAADAVAAEGPAGTPSAAGLVAPPAAPVAGLRASEAAAPDPGEAFTASRAASPAAEAPLGRLSEGQSLRRDNGAAPAPQDQTTVVAPERRASASEQAPPPTAVGWPKVAASALGLIAVVLWMTSLRWGRRAGGGRPRP
jgi:hypothetical protein